MSEELEAWLADRPQIIKDLAASHPPDGEYRLVGGGEDDDFYGIYSYSENGTMTVTRYTRLAGADPVPLWNVFGMKPEDLVRVDVPPTTEETS